MKGALIMTVACTLTGNTAAMQLNAYSDDNCQNYVATYYGKGVGQAENVPTFYSFRGIGGSASAGYTVYNNGGCSSDGYYSGTGVNSGTGPCQGYDGGFNCLQLGFECVGTTCD